jgi:hypothetical protein
MSVFNVRSQPNLAAKDRRLNIGRERQWFDTVSIGINQEEDLTIAGFGKGETKSLALELARELGFADRAEGELSDLEAKLLGMGFEQRRRPFASRQQY